MITFFVNLKYLLYVYVAPSAFDQAVKMFIAIEEMTELASHNK